MSDFKYNESIINFKMHYSIKFVKNLIVKQFNTQNIKLKSRIEKMG